jgi:hypothetical protein
MSGFCDFGVTEAKAKGKAEKKVSILDKSRNLKPVDVYEKELAEESESIFESMKSLQVSPEFDAPQFANDWISIAKNSIKCRSLVVMCRGEKLSKSGAPVISKATKKPVITWLPYDQNAQKGLGL